MVCSLRLQKFCCCCNLRTGTLVIGTVGWVFTVIELFYLVGPAVDSNNDVSFGDRHIQAVHRSNIFTQIGYGVVTLLVCILLVVGVYKKDKRYMLPWLVLKCFESIILVLGVGCLFIIACSVDSEDTDKGFLFFLTVILIISAAITWYCWLCVYSHYRLSGEGMSHDGIPPVYFTPTSAPPPAYQETEKSKFGLA